MSRSQLNASSQVSLAKFSWPNSADVKGMTGKSGEEHSPRRVWDLFSNRVVPFWVADFLLTPISHAWVDEKDRDDVSTPINGKEWPVPIPKDISLNLIRIEMLNMGMEYMWLDVLCLRQKEEVREDVRVEEWKLDVPIIGVIYQFSSVVIYLSGLGLPLSLKEGDLDSDRCWFRRAWTVQEVGFERIIAGDTPDGPMHAKPIDDNGNYETAVLTRFHKQLGTLHSNPDIFSVLVAMRSRVSTNPVDRVAGLVLATIPRVIPAYYESRSLEEAWIALVNTTGRTQRGLLFFQYPGIGLGSKKWRPTWDQVMTEPPPTFLTYSGFVQYDDEKDEDWVDVFCIEKGLLRGLDVVVADGLDRLGEFVVKDVAGTAYTFKIRVAHHFLIPEDIYTLLCALPVVFHGKPQDVTKPRYWAVGRQLPDQRFEKVSVVVMDDWREVERLHSLDAVVTSQHFVLV
ncbi:hypothetical protein EDD18DRAFT_1339105 [Armillaria luteobubalina]|uniref:Heterokaryon incompatibility domain-containing protein n=1 Tax=Armillaria luteobubalina TaxID=153913 RepID=A0AA39U036_9AGAR|nr:hypothetical protein EDD18DRAFT_1339105 [Armillaria luteobubalina]